MIWVCGFAGILAIIGIMQMVKMIEDGEVAPRHVWKWFVLLSAVWPIFAALFVVLALLSLVIPQPKIMPAKVRPPLMEKKQFAFTVKVNDEAWDCYHFWSTDKKLGTLGFTKREGKFVIGLMCAGHLTETEAAKRLEEGEKKEAN